MNRIHRFFKKRPLWQALAALATNPHLGNFVTGKIYTGSAKAICVPGLNCYSCPAATGACPIGSLQAVLGGHKHNFSYYVVGFLLLFGVLFGRLVCGLLCPFGFVQDLLYKIPIPKLKISPKIEKPLRYLKYIVLAVFVVALPLLLTNNFGMGAPYFCKLICPAGTLEGGLPLLATNASLRNALGWLFNWKLLVLVLTLTASVFIYRPFCKYLCPLGAIYSLFNRFSFYQMEVSPAKCNGCKACERHCKMGVAVTQNINSAECIRCGECLTLCPQQAITAGIRLRPDPYSALADPQKNP